jgi:CRISPR-associated endoribonuclease Cas6
VRVRITFRVVNRGAVVPFHHQPIIAQLIKGLLLGSRFETFTHYNFSGLKGQTNVGREGLFVVSSKVTIVVSSQNAEFIQFLVDQLFHQEEMGLAALRLSPESADKEIKPDFNEFARFICISPVLLLAPTFNSDEAKQFVMPDQDDFSDFLYENTIRKMTSAGYNISQISGVEKFQIIPDMDYLNKLKSANKKFSRIYSFYDQDVMYESRGYTFPFSLYAAPEVLDFVYVRGFGHFNHKGFGMIDVASSADAIKKTEPFLVAQSLKTA